MFAHGIREGGITMIDTIIYDMGNVLIEWNPEKFLHLIETDEYFKNI